MSLFKKKNSAQPDDDIYDSGVDDDTGDGNVYCLAGLLFWALFYIFISAKIYN